MEKYAQVLVITPHPDDAEFDAAGTVAYLAKEGKDIIYIVCTNGNKGTADRNMKSEKLAEVREQGKKLLQCWEYGRWYS